MECDGKGTNEQHPEAIGKFHVTRGVADYKLFNYCGRCVNTDRRDGFTVEPEDECICNEQAPTPAEIEG
jgi:hypothetical protein